MEQQRGRANPLSFSEELKEQVNRGLIAPDQAKAVWDAYASAVARGGTHVLQGGASVWGTLLGGVLGRGITFQTALERWRRFLDGGLLPGTTVSTGMFPPDAGAGIRPTWA